MALTTPRYVLPYPVAADANNVPSDMLALATALDNKMSSFISTTAALRPAASLSGRVHFATDTKEISYDTGAVWRSLTGAPVIPMGRYYLTTTPASNVTFAAIAWNATSFNRNGFPVAATKIIVPVTGYWKIRATARWNIGGAGLGQVLLQIRQGPNSDTAGTPIATAQRSANWTLAYDNDISAEVECRVSLAAGADVAIWHSATPASTIYGSGEVTFVEAELVSVT